jgi:cbb3-type cytochrome oxidase subunit 3
MAAFGQSPLPSIQMTNSYLEAGLVFVMLLIWAASISFMFRTLKASQEKKDKVKRVLTKMVFISGRLWWIERPENKEDKEKIQKFANAVGTMAIELSVVALILFGMGCFFALSMDDKFPIFLLNVFGGPSVALFALYYAFLWKLLSSKNTNGQL